MFLLGSSDQYRALTSLIDASDHEQVRFLPVALDEGTGALAGQLADRGTPLRGLRTTPGWSTVPVAAARLARLVKELRPDVIHSNLFFPSLVGEAARRLLPSAPPSAVCRHHNAQHHLQGKRRHVAVDRGVARSATRVIAVSEAVRRTMTDREGVSGAKIDVVYNGYDWSALTPSPAGVQAWKERFSGSRLIVAAGRLDPIKDLPNLLEAFALVSQQFPDARLAMAGTGPPEVSQSLRSRAAALGIAERVELVGYIDRLQDLVGAADVFAQASLDEACSQTISEALGLGVPVAVTTTGGTAELVAGLQGPLPPSRPDLLAARMTSILAAPAAARAEAEAAAPAVRDRFSTRRQLESNMHVYRSLATDRRAG